MAAARQQQQHTELLLHAEAVLLSRRMQHWRDSP